MLRRVATLSNPVTAVAFLAVLSALAGCSSSDASGDLTNGTAGASPRCEVGSWRSTLVTVPAQANIDKFAAGAGGDGIDIRLGADGSFFVDFGPMRPATGTFVVAGEQGTLSAVWTGVGEGTWTGDGDAPVVAVIADLTTARASASLTLGTTTPPLFDDTLQGISDEMLLDDRRMGEYTVTECDDGRLVMTTPYPGGTAVVEAERL